MTYVSCPTAAIDAPVALVWQLLTTPAGWGDVFDLRVTAIEPPGLATIGQRICGETGPRFLHLKICFQFVGIDPACHALSLNVRLPFDLTVSEQLDCIPLTADRCRVNYHCVFDFPAGWRGALTRVLLRRALDNGPADSLSRLKQAAERLHASTG